MFKSGLFRPGMRRSWTLSRQVSEARFPGKRWLVSGTWVTTQGLGLLRLHFCVCVVCMCRRLSEGNLGEGSFHRVGPGDRSYAVRISSKYPYLLGHLSGILVTFFFFLLR